MSLPYSVVSLFSWAISSRMAGENALSAISALTNIRLPYSASNSLRKGDASIAWLQAFWHSCSWGMASFQKFISSS